MVAQYVISAYSCVGRGARWMPVAEGTDRDVLVIHTIRETAGPDSKILIDANNGTPPNYCKGYFGAMRRCGWQMANPDRRRPIILRWWKRDGLM